MDNNCKSLNKYKKYATNGTEKGSQLILGQEEIYPITYYRAFSK